MSQKPNRKPFIRFAENLWWVIGNLVIFCVSLCKPQNGRWNMLEKSPEFFELNIIWIWNSRTMTQHLVMYRNLSYNQKNWLVISTPLDIVPDKKNTFFTWQPRRGNFWSMVSTSVQLCVVENLGIALGSTAPQQILKWLMPKAILKWGNRSWSRGPQFTNSTVIYFLDPFLQPTQTADV